MTSKKKTPRKRPTAAKPPPAAKPPAAAKSPPAAKPPTPTATKIPLAAKVPHAPKAPAPANAPPAKKAPTAAKAPVPAKTVPAKAPPAPDKRPVPAPSKPAAPGDRTGRALAGLEPARARSLDLLADLAAARRATLQRHQPPAGHPGFALSQDRLETAARLAHRVADEQALAARPLPRPKSGIWQLAGIATHADGSPAAGVDVRVQVTGIPAATATATTNSDGSFLLRVPLTAQPPGSPALTADLDLLGPSGAQHLRRLTRVHPGTVAAIRLVLSAEANQ